MVAGDPDQCSIAVAVDETDRLRHAGTILCTVRDQRGAGQRLVQIPADRVGLADPHPVDVKDRDLAEGMPGQVLRLPRLARQNVDRHLVIIGAFVSKNHADSPDVGGAIEAVESGFVRHRILPSWSFAFALAIAR